jgi:hypothetical protein
LHGGSKSNIRGVFLDPSVLIREGTVAGISQDIEKEESSGKADKCRLSAERINDIELWGDTLVTDLQVQTLTKLTRKKSRAI